MKTTHPQSEKPKKIIDTERRRSSAYLFAKSVEVW